MIPVVLGGIALTAVGYGIAKVLEDECDCFTTTKTAPTKDNTLEEFYIFSNDVLNSSYKDFQEILKNVQNLNLDEPKEIKTNQSYPKTDDNIEKINHVADDLYKLLDYCNTLFRENIVKLNNIVNVSTVYNSYSQNAKNLFSATVALENIISDILYTNVINKNDKPSKSTKKLVKEINKLIDTFKENLSEEKAA